MVERALVQLAGGVLFAVILPWLLRVALEPIQAGITAQQNAVIGTLVALGLGQFFLRGLTRFPGIRAINYVVPTFAMAYGVVLATFFLFRLDYSRVQFIASFGLCLAWYIGISVYRLDRRTLRIGLVPVGGTAVLHAIDNVEWVALTKPEAPLGELDGIVADLRADMSDEWERFLTECALAGVPVYHVKQIQESLTGRVEIEHLSENNFGSLIPGLAYLTIKQVFDVAAAAVVAAVLAPFGLIVALIIRWDTPGPILFRQERMGYRGRAFTVFKFRTMAHRTQGAGDALNEAITAAKDDRITRAGRFLRRTRIDELPQILNILRGEMSWIGPRPEAMVLSLWYERELPFYRYRHIVRPGISGWAQVNQGHVSGVDEVLWKLHYDFYYIKNLTPWLDLLIMFRTMSTVLTGFGSK